MTQHEADVLASQLTNELEGVPDLGPVLLDMAQNNPEKRQAIEILLADTIRDFVNSL